MASLWSLVAQTKNRQVLSWVGGAIVVLATGAWAVITYVWPASEAPKIACTQQGVTVGGNVSRSTVTNTVTGSSDSGPCAETKAHH